MALPTKELALSAVFAALTATGALISFPIPISPTPVTLQSLFTYLSGGMLGPRLGALSQLLYLTIRTSGLSTPAGTLVGPGLFLTPSGGFLLGFILGAFTIGWLSRRLPVGFKGILFSNVIGSAAIYLFAITYSWGLLIAYQGLGLAPPDAISRLTSLGFSALVIPFIPGDSLKVLAASYIASRKGVLRATRSLDTDNRSSYNGRG